MRQGSRHRKALFSLIACGAMGLALGAFSGCAVWKKTLSSMGFAGADGIPLNEFKASARDYFPPYIMKFFRGAAFFADVAPTMEKAREGMVLIEVKQLSEGDPPQNESNLSWSADGAWLGFEVSDEIQNKIMVKNIPGDYVRELSVKPARGNDFLEGMVVGSAQSYNASLRWSKDSTRYAFMSNGGTGTYNIYVGAIGGEEKQITRGSTKDGYATWSGASNEIAFVSGRSGSGDIYVVDLATESHARLTRGDEVDLFPEWFPSGNRLVYSSGDAMAHRLMVVSRATTGQPWGEPEPLTTWEQDDLRPIVSPDGRYVAFYSTDGHTGEDGLPVWNIHVLKYEPGKSYGVESMTSSIVARNVVIDLNTGPAWTPDGRKILFVRHDPAEFNPICGYDVFTGQSFVFRTKTRMNRDLTISRLGVLSFRAQVGVWDRVFIALTNQGIQIQRP